MCVCARAHSEFLDLYFPSDRYRVIEREKEREISIRILHALKRERERDRQTEEHVC